MKKPNRFFDLAKTDAPAAKEKMEVFGGVRDPSDFEKYQNSHPELLAEFGVTTPKELWSTHYEASAYGWYLGDHDPSWLEIKDTSVGLVRWKIEGGEVVIMIPSEDEDSGWTSYNYNYFEDLYHAMVAEIFQRHLDKLKELGAGPVDDRAR